MLLIQRRNSRYHALLSTITNMKIPSSTCRRDQHERKDPASHLEKVHCEAAFEVFNHDQHLESNLEIIWPVLPEILQSAILGLSEVEHYFSHRGQKLEIPRELAD